MVSVGVRDNEEFEECWVFVSVKYSMLTGSDLRLTLKEGGESSKICCMKNIISVLEHLNIEDESSITFSVFSNSF